MIRNFAFNLRLPIIKMSKMIKKITLSVLTLICFTSLLVAQVGIGTTTPDLSAMLDIESTNSGILIPRVELIATNSQVPIAAPTPETGLMVFNTATDGTAPNNVTPGFYYWQGPPTSQWIRINSGASTDWAMTGNAGTTPGTGAGENYIGTTDAQDVVIATGGTERMRVDATGNVGINTAPAERLHVDGNLQIDGALMPGGDAGNADQILISKGAGNEPEWGPGFLNVAAISNIGKFFAGPFNSNTGTFLTLTVTDPNMTVDTVVSFNLTGPLPAGPQWGNTFRMGVEPRNGEVRFYIGNGSGFNITGLQIAYTAFYN